MANVVNWSLRKNAIPTDDSTIIVNQRLTTLTPNNTRGYVSLGLTDKGIENLNVAIQTDGKVTYAFVDQNGNVGRQFNNIKEISDHLSGGMGTNYLSGGGISTNTIKKIQNSLQQQLTNRTKEIIINGGAQSPYSQAQGEPNNDGVDPTTLTKDTTNLTIKPKEVRSLFGPYRYPTNLGSNGQDFIQFTIKKYKARNFNLEGAIGILEKRQEVTPIGTISLPIQPSISDSNNVDWNSGRLNPLEMELVNGSLNIMSQQGQKYVNDLIKRLETTIQDPNTLKAIKLYFAQKAASVNGLLSRLGGGIVNPNLELLFQGPTLRPFTFTFRLSPRDEDEAKQVRSIIRAFKEAMSVKTASQSFFLAAPYVFDIKYVMGGQTDHPSLNKIKTCALKSCNVDYTPDGSYMTFNDKNATMTSYNLTLQFQELEPVTNQDYKDDQGNLLPEDQIGY